MSLIALYRSVDEVCSLLSMRRYARKRVLRCRDSERNRLAQHYLVEELKNLKGLRHKHLVKIIGSYTDDHYIAYIMLPIAQYNLQTLLNQTRALKPEEASMVREFYGCLAGAVHYLHKHRIRHRDLSGRNILIEHGRVYISDFGSAYNSSNRTTSMTRHRQTPVSPDYMAPEIARGDDRDSSSDMWSLGILYLEMMTKLCGRLLGELRKSIHDHARTKNAQPYLYCNTPVIQSWIKVLRQNNSDNYSDNEPLEWITSLLHVSPNRRPTAKLLMKDILESPSFSTFCCIDCEADLRDSGFAYDSAMPKPEVTEDTEQVLNTLAAVFESNHGLDGFQVHSAEKTSSMERWVESVSFEELNNTSHADQVDMPTIKTSTFYTHIPGGFDIPEKGTTPPNIPSVSDDANSYKRRSEPVEYIHDYVGSAKRMPCQWPEEIEDEDLPALVPKLPEGMNVRDSGMGFVEYDSGGSEDEDGEDERLFDEVSDGDDSDSSSVVTAIPNDSNGHGDINLMVSTTSEQNGGTFDPNGAFTDDKMFDEVISDDDSEPVEHTVNIAEIRPLTPTHSKIKSLRIQVEELKIDTAEERVDSQLAGASWKLEASHLASAMEQPNSSKLGDTESEHTPLQQTEARHEIEKDPPASRYIRPSVEDIKETEDISHNARAEDVDANDSELLTNADTHDAADLPFPVITRAYFGRNNSDNLQADSVEATTRRKKHTKPKVTIGGVEWIQFEDDADKGTEIVDIDTICGVAPLSATNLSALNSERGPKTERRAPVGSLNLESFFRNTWENASSAPTSVVTARTRARIEASLLPLNSLDRSLNLLTRYCREGKAGAVKLLLSHGCNPGTRKRPYSGPIFAATKGGTNGHFKCVKALIAKGVDVNAKKSRSGKTPLHFAIEHEFYSHYEKLIWLLVDAGCDTNAQDSNGERPIIMLLNGSDSRPLDQHRLRALAIILNANTIVNATLPETGNTPLHLAVRRQDKWAVAMLLYKGANVNATNFSGTTPLQITANQFRGELTIDHAQVLKFLLDATKKTAVLGESLEDRPPSKLFKTNATLQVLMETDRNP
jgi:serine/threonine protein kinase/ankyrin repeat protein